TLAAIVSVYYSRKNVSRRLEDEELGRRPEDEEPGQSGQLSPTTARGPEGEEVGWLSRTCANCMRCGLCGCPLPERSGIEELRRLSTRYPTRCTRCGNVIPGRPSEPLTEVEWLSPILPPVPPTLTSGAK